MIVNAIVALVAILLAGMTGYWAQDRDPPIVFKSITIDSAPILKGGQLRIIYDIERYKICHVVLEQFLFDSANTRFHLADDDFISSPGQIGRDIFAVAVRIPVNVAEGPARYRAVRAYRCNPIHNWFFWPIVVTTPDISFTIDPGIAVDPVIARTLTDQLLAPKP